MLAVALAVFALDQWTKHWATATLADRPPVEVIGTLVRLTYTRNSGVAFGLGAGTRFPFYVFSIAAACGIVWLIARGRVRRPLHQIALALILGGALGNLVDRVTTGLVVDFILLSFRQWDFPVFNVADSAVTVGVALFALTWPGHHEAPAAGTAGTPAGAVAAEAATGASPEPPVPLER
jgi:signal peptidase II